MSVAAMYRSTIGKKVIMALTGLVIFGWVTGHMLGNLQVFLGPEKLNDYAFFLKHTPSLLWGVRTILFVCVVAHIATAIRLTAIQRRARPVAYKMRRGIESTFASRTMLLSGLLLFVFIIYHLLHMTIGAVHPHWSPEDPATGRVDVYANLVSGLSVPWVAGFYIVAMSALGLHMWHGVWSVFQSLGVNNARTDSFFRKFAMILTSVVVAGFVSIPIAILAGLGSNP